MKKENQNKSWKIIEEKIQTSKIKRYPWKNILNMTLTIYTQKLINKGYDSDEIVRIISTHRNVRKYIEENKKEEKKIIENLNTSVASHCCKYRTIQKVKEEKKK
jgi:uncharacterized protein YktA (UPF0223 family)